MIDVASQSTRAWTASRAARVVSGVLVLATLRPDSPVVSSFRRGGVGNGYPERESRIGASLTQRGATDRRVARAIGTGEGGSMAEPRRSTTRASAPTRNLRTREGATHPRNRPQSAPASRSDGVSRDGAQKATAATPTFTEVTPRAVKYATVVAFLAWT